jgi:1-phosphofructokinase
MIVTVTPNPCLDRTAEIAELEAGHVCRIIRNRIDPGGKGVNVSRVLSAAGSPTLAVMPLGGVEGEKLAGLLVQEQVPVIGVAIAESTRTNMTIVERSGRTTKINERGPSLSEEEFRAFRQTILENIRGAEWLVACGSLPLGVPDEFYSELVDEARANGVRIAVDATGIGMQKVMAAAPDLIKPNHLELADLVGRELNTLGDVITCAQGLVAHGISQVLVSLGAYGAVLVTESGTWHAISDPVEVRSTVGAGDSALGGFLLSGATGPDSLLSAVAYGSAAVTQVGTRLANPHEVDLSIVHLVDINPALSLEGAC